MTDNIYRHHRNESSRSKEVNIKQSRPWLIENHRAHLCEYTIDIVFTRKYNVIPGRGRIKCGRTIKYKF